MEDEKIAAKQVLELTNLIPTEDIQAHIEEHSITHELYDWRFDGTFAKVPIGGCIKFDDKNFLYTGIAPPKDRTTGQIKKYVAFYQNYGICRESRNNHKNSL